MRITLKFWLGIALCGGTAVVLCVLLRDGGVTAAHIDIMLRDNPARLLGL
jgi:hypothetical protein